MIIVKIVGGLGNQMFCYAFAKAVEKRGYEVKIDISAYQTYPLYDYALDQYDIDLMISTKEEISFFYSEKLSAKIMRKLGFDFSKKIVQKDLLYDEKYLMVDDNNYIEGYFQSEKYFNNVKEVLLKQFKIKHSLSDYTKSIQKKIINTNNSCSIHVRRGDYLDSKFFNVHGICDLEYYLNSIRYLVDNYGECNYFIFSDDIDWCKNNLKINNAFYIDSSEARIPHEDMYLMSLCNYNIIANSSFSWWAAWLNKNSSKVSIAPKQWFADSKLQKQTKDLFCEDWIKI